MMRVLKWALGAVAAVASAVVFLWFASQWWEKAFATARRTEVSPGGCYRLVQYTPYWVIPGSFHPARDPQEKWTPLDNWYTPWMPNEVPGFFRLYDHRTGKKLGESAVYDLTMIGPGSVHWPNEHSRRMSVGFVYLARDLQPCEQGASLLEQATKSTPAFARTGYIPDLRGRRMSSMPSRIDQAPLGLAP